jgi:hypothetical protein
MALPNNPASRLLRVLTAVRGQNPLTPSLPVWGAVLVEKDGARLLQRLGKVFALPQRVREEILKIEGLNHDRYLRWIPDLEKAFLGQALVGTIQGFRDFITQDLLDRIEFCADQLSERRPEKSLSNEELESLRNELSEIDAELKSAKIDSALKEYISRQLAEIISAIGNYDLEGIGPLERALHATVGAAVTDWDTTRKVRETSAGQRFWKFVGRAAIVINLLHTALQLPSDFQHLLGLPAPIHINVEDSNESRRSPHQDKPVPQAPIQVAKASTVGNEKS